MEHGATAAVELQDRAVLLSARRKKRERRAMLAAVTAAFAKGGAYLLTLATIPIVLPVLGPHSFGIWVSTTSLLGLLNLMDLGLGHNLTNLVARAASRGNLKAAGMYHSTTLFVTLVISAGLFLAMAGATAIAPHLAPGSALGAAARDNVELILAASAAFALTLTAGVVSKAQAGVQESHIGNMWLLVGGCCALALTAAAARWAPRPGLLVFAAVSGPVIGAAFNYVHGIYGRHRHLHVSLSAVRPRILPRVLALSLPIVACQAGNALSAAVPTLVAAKHLGAESAGYFSILYRYFAVFYLATSTLLTPLWAAYADSHAHRDREWIRNTIVRSILYTAAAGAIALGLGVVAAPPAIEQLSRGSFSIATPLAVLFAVWMLLLSLRHCLSMAAGGLQSLGASRFVFPLIGLIPYTLLLLPHGIADIRQVVALATLIECVFVASLAFDLRRVLRETQSPLPVIQSC